MIKAKGCFAFRYVNVVSTLIIKIDKYISKFVCRQCIYGIA